MKASQLIAERLQCPLGDAGEALVALRRDDKLTVWDSRTLEIAPSDWSWFGRILGTGAFREMLVSRADIDRWLAGRDVPNVEAPANHNLTDVVSLPQGMPHLTARL